MHEEKTCAQKVFSSICFNLFFYLCSYAALVFISGGVFRLGGIILTKAGHDQYDIYASEIGYKMGIISGAFWSLFTAASMTGHAYTAFNSASESISEKLFVNTVMGGSTFSLFGITHVSGLPFAEKIALSCMSFTEQQTKNPRCNQDNKKAIYYTLLTGMGACAVPLMLLYSLYVFSLVFCKKQTSTVATPGTTNLAPEVITGTCTMTNEPFETHTDVMQP